MTDLLTLDAIGADGIREILALSQATDLGTPLAGKGVALVFEKPSARTRNSMEMAVVQLGGHPVYIQNNEVGIGTRETAEDVARTLACFHSVIAARVFDHGNLELMAAAVDTPVLNMLSDSDHPLQGLADALTIQQLLGDVKGAKVAYVGDANNVAKSLAEICDHLGGELTLACPDGYTFSDNQLAAWPSVRQVTDPKEAVKAARIVYTDTWISMGEEAQADVKRKVFAPYQVDEALMALSDDAWFMHCLPAHRGEEVTDGVMDGPKSAIWRQAENRMHTARGALAWMMRAR